MNKVASAFIVGLVLNGCGESEPPRQADAYPVRCNGMPEFTLGPGQKLDQAQTSVLCECISSRVEAGSEWEIDTLRKIADGRESEISDMHMRAFPSRFGGYIMACSEDVL